MGDERKLRYDHGAVEKLLDRLDRGGGTVGARDGQVRAGRENVRDHGRFAYRVRDMHVEIEQPGGALLRFSAPSRNISAGGVGFLVSSFVYPGAKCSVALLTPDKKSEATTGKVTRCRYLEGSVSVYEVGVKFDADIDVERFTREQDRMRLLLVDDDEACHAGVRELAASANVECRSVSTAASAIETALANPFDLILMDVDMPGVDGLQATRALRAAGYGGPIVAVVGLAGETSSVEQCLAAGCNGQIKKPYDSDALLEQMRVYRAKSESERACQEPNLADLIDRFMAGLPGLTRQLARAAEENRGADVAAISRQLRDDAGSFGLEDITSKAGIVAGAASGKDSLAGISAQLEELIRLCALTTGSTN